jgi:two-component system chemotaxis sensor kinase CheA
MDENEKKFEEESAENIIATLREAFQDEAYELLGELENALLELEETPDDGELIGRVFRVMHTIKGSGSACGLNDVAAFTHELETFFDTVRKGKISVTKEIVDLTLKARDQIKAMFDAYYRGGSADTVSAGDIAASFKNLLPLSGGKQIAASPSGCHHHENAGSSPVVFGKNVTYRIRFRPAQDILSQGVNPVSLLDELRRLGYCKVVAQTDAIPNLEDFNPECCYTYWDVILTTRQGMNAIKDVFIFVKDTSELKVDVIDEDGRLDDQKSYKRLAEILVERGDLTHDDLQKALKTKKLIGEMLVEAGVVVPGHVESALVEQQHVRDIREKRQSIESSSSIRVSTSKLDSLVDLVSEMVTVQARFSQAAALSDNPQLLSIAEEVERLVGELRDNTMSIRMMPIGTTFNRFKRVVRDLSSELGKETELVTDGAETELDKTVIERLSDPLVHLIRNCIDHGIEPPEVRTAAGKPRQGAVHLSATHSGAHVLIQIRDDGAGLDANGIRAKAMEKGLIDGNAPGLLDRELFQFILAPGFSTAKKVTGVSGRGVGLDVVKKAIDALRGSMEISSQRGLGTTITLKLPLTLAIIDGFLTKIGAEYFVFPLSLVEECVELTREGVNNSHGRNIANVRGDIVPYIRLRERFSIDGELPSIEQIVITRVEDKRVGFVVDHIIGGHQTVIKNLGGFYRNVEGISGATILGDGTVALILDVPKLARLAEVQEKEEVNTVAAGRNGYRKLL